MSQKILVEAVMERCKVGRGVASEAVTAVLDSIADQLKQGESLRLKGFGVFDILTVGVGEEKTPRTVARFRASKELREQLPAKAREAEKPAE